MVCEIGDIVSSVPANLVETKWVRTEFYELSLVMVSGMRTNFPCRLNEVFTLILSDGYLDWKALGPKQYDNIIIAMTSRER